MSDLLRERLQSLSFESVSKELGAYLHAIQINALIARRDLILREIDTTDVL